MTDRQPHPSAHTHGDDFSFHLLDRILTELEGIHDHLAGRSSEPPPTEPSAPESTPAAEPVTDSVPVDITEPAIAPATPPRKRAVKAAPPASKES